VVHALELLLMALLLHPCRQVQRTVLLLLLILSKQSLELTCSVGVVCMYTRICLESLDHWVAGHGLLHLGSI
jgi:hypothetical protein